MDRTLFDPKRFRNVLGRFTTGVTIVTARAPDGDPVGVTANSFNSVSLQPPLVLWSLAKTSRSMATFELAEYWAVHILSAEQESLANRFATRGTDKFATISTQPGLGGIPLIADCTARLQCKTALKYEGGDHIIFVGEVLDFEDRETTPLVYHMGQYALAARKIEGISLSNPPAPELNVGFDEDFLGYLLARAHFQFFSRMSEVMQSLDLDDVHLYILFGLSVKESLSIDELNLITRPARQEITPEAIAILFDRGYVSVKGEGTAAILQLTTEGRTTALDSITRSKAIESEVLGHLGYWYSSTFKNCLKQFVLQTDAGLPHPWGTLTTK
jgi:3-hydroxy-9,10-secoandrosta-1,3,5(10)-triene-9,17-dione monooxygenase reductase component